MARSLVTAVLVLGLPASASASALITFEELPGGLTAMPNAFTLVPSGSQLGTQYLSTDGVVFSSSGGFAALVNHDAPTASMPNIIGGTNASGVLDYDEWITISFFDPTNPTQRAVTDFFEIQGDWAPLGSGSVFAEAYDVNGVLLASTSAPDVSSGVAGAFLNLTAPGIHSVRFRGDNGTVGFDNLEFGDLTPVPVAEPALAGLLVSAAFLATRRQPRAAR